MDRLGSSFSRALRRLWATLLLACALSLVNGAVAGAAEVGVDLQEMSRALADTSAACGEAEPSDADGTAKVDHCALCCAHSAVAIPSVAAAVVATATTSAARLAPPTLARSAVPDPTDQPPRA